MPGLICVQEEMKVYDHDFSRNGILNMPYRILANPVHHSLALWRKPVLRRMQFHAEEL